jgi:hypothetical protein
MDLKTTLREQMQSSPRNMEQETQEIDALLQRWLSVWHEGRLDLVASCVAPAYIRHEVDGMRTVSPDEYAIEIKTLCEAISNLRFVEHDRAVAPPKVWVRWTLTGTLVANGEPVTRAGIQIYRVENGRLAETWVLNRGMASSWEKDNGLG